MPLARTPLDRTPARATLAFLATVSPALITTSVLDRMGAIIAVRRPPAPTLLGLLIALAILVSTEQVSLAMASLCFFFILFFCFKKS